MLVLSRKIGERILIEPDIEIVVVDVRGGKVRIGIEAPPMQPYSPRRDIGLSAVKSAGAGQTGKESKGRGFAAVQTMSCAQDLRELDTPYSNNPASENLRL